MPDVSIHATDQLRDLSDSLGDIQLTQVYAPDAIGRFGREFSEERMTRNKKGYSQFGSCP